MDPDLEPYVPLLPPLRLDDLPARRTVQRAALAKMARAEVPDSVVVTEATLPGPAGAPPVPVRVYRPRDAPGPAPLVLWLHGGAYCLGDLDLEDGACLRIVATTGAVVVNVDYRLAPEHPYPAALEDSYAALVGAVGTLPGIDPDRVVLAGSSAGAGLAAAVALAARDRGEVAVCFQFLVSPTLDDRCVTASARAAVDTPVLDRTALEDMWRLYLGEPRPDPVPAYAAPARAESLAGLPPAYLAVGAVDPLRDEVVAYAARLLADGVPTELHVVPGAPHGYDAVPGVPVVLRMQEEYVAVLTRAVGAADGIDRAAGTRPALSW